MFRRRILLVCLLIGGVAVSGSALAADGFSVEMDSTVAVPEQTIDNPEGESTFTVSEIGVVAPGESVTVEATPPDETPYFVFLRDSEGNVVIRTDRLADSQSVELNTSAEPAGSYVVTIGPDSTPEDILPVVIEAYQVASISVNPQNTSTGQDEFTVNSTESAKVNVELTQQAEEPITTVNLTVWNEATGVVETVTLAANESADGEYRYQGSIPELEPGEYNIQLGVQGTGEVSGRSALIGLSDNSRLTVTEPTDDSETTDDSPSDDDSQESSDSTQSGDETSDGTGTQSGDDGESTAGGNGTDSTSDTSAGQGTTNGTEPNGSDSDSSGSTSSNGSANGSEGVITPNAPGEGENTNGSVPLRVVPHVLTLVVVAGVAKRLRSTSKDR